MANPEHLALLKQGVEAWNKWCQVNPYIKPDLSEANLREENLVEANLIEANLYGADLYRADLHEADLSWANLGGANLGRANLYGANLGWANLSRADLYEANLSRADLYRADLRGADLGWADLSRANLYGANLGWANLGGTILQETILSDIVLIEAKGLDTCRHEGPSTLDFRTLQQSGRLPLAFLRGCGLPDLLIDYFPSILNQPIQFYSCFISYSSKDEDFAQRLHADLQNKECAAGLRQRTFKEGAKSMSRLVRQSDFMRNCC